MSYCIRHKMLTAKETVGKTARQTVPVERREMDRTEMHT
jgi:hypothetical protein